MVLRTDLSDNENAATLHVAQHNEANQALLDLQSRASFSNTNYTISTNVSYVAQTGTLSAPRTVTLPSAATATAGKRITIADESGSTTADNYLIVTAAGADTIVNPSDLNDTTTVYMKGPEVLEFISNGTNRWMVSNPGVRRPYCWWTHERDLAVPSGVWVPLPWNPSSTTYADEFGLLPVLPGAVASTTVTSGSNGVALPTGTINVTDTTAFTSNGYLVIEGPPGAGDDTIVTYTGKTGTTFTGCNSGYRGGGTGIATGTLATGQTVRQANVEWVPPTGYLWLVIVDIAMDLIPTASSMDIRFRQIDNFLNLSIFQSTCPGVNRASPGQHLLLSGQPGLDAAAPARIEVRHDSGSVKLSRTDGIQAPSIMQAFLSTR
jgi:hypothetical protein